MKELKYSGGIANSVVEVYKIARNGVLYKWENAKKQFAHIARVAEVKYDIECDNVSIRAYEYSGGAYRTYDIGKYFSRLRSVNNE